MTTTAIKKIIEALIKKRLKNAPKRLSKEDLKGLKGETKNRAMRYKKEMDRRGKEWHKTKGTERLMRKKSLRQKNRAMKDMQDDFGGY